MNLQYLVTACNRATSHESLTIHTVRRLIKKAYCELHNWRKVGDLFSITCGLAYRIANHGYEPKNPKIRLALGLSAMLPAPACPVCGEVHTTKRCTKIARSYQSWFDMPVKQLRAAIQNREEIQL